MKTQSILLLSCYELGHQPLSLAWPLAALNAAGLPVTATDLAVEDFPVGAAAEAALVAIAVPMHTALRIGVEAARQVRAVNPAAHICFFGLYAWMNRAFLLGREAPRIGDSVLGGEVEPVLVDLARAVLAGEDPAGIPGVTTAAEEAAPHLARLTFPLPARDSLPALESYARYMENGAAHLAGYVEASRGCLHTCRHCPVVPIYNGRFFIVPVETVLADIRQQVEAGARHITFGDPDFLNGPGHARKIAQSLHSEFPALTFDFTTKVEHILQHQELIPELAACGATFVVSAFESTSEVVLARLHKGHTLADMDAAVAILLDAGLAPQPTWMPFTPWTSLDDYLHLLAWIRRRDLILYVPAVQLSIRMLVPPGSALLAEPDTVHWIGDLDAENFSYRWAHSDPRMDELQRTVAQLAEHAGDDANPYDTFALVEHAAYSLAHQLPPAPAVLPRITVQPPRMTEHWFC